MQKLSNRTTGVSRSNLAQVLSPRKKCFVPGLHSSANWQKKDKPKWQRLVTMNSSQIFKLGTEHIFNCKRWQAIVQTRRVADFLSCIFRKVVLLSHWLQILPYHTLTQNLLLLVSKGLIDGWKKTEMTPEFSVLQCSMCWQSGHTQSLADFSVALSKDGVWLPIKVHDCNGIK